MNPTKLGTRTGGRLLWYEFSPLPFRVPKGLPCHREDVDGVIVIEHHRDDDAYPYGLRLEAMVGTQSELNAAKATASSLDKQLRRVWPYIAGAPLTIRPSRMSVSVDGPFGWRTNHGELRQKLPGAHVGFTVGKSVRDFGITLVWMPLKPVLEALPAFRAADPMTAALIDLHLHAWDNYQHSVEVFLFAKTLELATALLPGVTMAHKQKHLPQPFAVAMTNDLSWLKQIANTRLDARHAVQKSRRGAPQLHARMSREERRGFIDDADIAIRGVISGRLHVDLNTIRRHE